MDTDSLFFSLLFFCLAVVFSGFVTFLYGLNTENQSLIGLGLALIGSGILVIIFGLIALLFYLKVKK